MVQTGASDLHLSVSVPPMVPRIPDTPIISASMCRLVLL